jgi:hypothetical protein
LSKVARSLIGEKFIENINIELDSMQLNTDENRNLCHGIFHEFREIEPLISIEWYFEMLINVEDTEPLFEFIDQ